MIAPNPDIPVIHHMQFTPEQTIITAYQTVSMELIQLVLWQRFRPVDMVVTNDSGAHRSHNEAKRAPLKGHFSLHLTVHDIQSLGQTRVTQHRAIYAALKGLMHRIHALSITIDEG